MTGYYGGGHYHIKPKPSKPVTVNAEDRRQWVQNDAGLYQWWQDSGIGLYRFERENRAELTRIIKGEMERGPN
jgi:hypothetical protein